MFNGMNGLEILKIWPRYEDGGLVQTGIDAADVEGNVLDEPVVSIEFFENGFTLHGDASQAFYGYEERVKRPAVLAADGEPLEAGQTVYHTDTGREYQIHSINDDGKGAFVYNNSLGQDACGLHLCPAGKLTHQRPVLDADGVPIHEGDTVWNATTGARPLTVREIERSDDPDEPEDIVWCGERAANGFKVWRIADQLTHAKPEPQEKTCGDCCFWQSDPDARQMGVCWNSYAERDSYDSYEARVKNAHACEDFAERGE